MVSHFVPISWDVGIVTNESMYSVNFHMACSVFFLPTCFLSMVDKTEPVCFSSVRRNFYQQ